MTRRESPLVRRSIPILFLLAIFLSRAAALGDRLDDLREDLARSVRVDDLEEAASLVEEIASLGTPEAMETLLAAALAVEDPEIYEAVEEAIGETDSAEAIRHLGGLLERDRGIPRRLRRWEMRALVAQAFGGRDDGATRGPLVTAMDDPAFPVRLQAVRSLGRRGETHAVPAIIDLIEEEEEAPGVLWDEAHRALRRITGQDLPAAADWRTWWEAHGKAPPPPPPGDGEEVDPRSTRSDSPRFFGVEIISKRVVFLIDVSGSMQLWDPGGGGEQPRGPGGGAGYSPARKRIARAKRELIRVIEDLRPEVGFGIIAFSHEMTHFQEGRLVPASRRNKAAAIEFARGLRADGGTATDEALEQAFRIPEANTIILLADGVVDKPGGDNPTPAAIRRRVEELNRFRKVKIHTFGFDGEGKRPDGFRGGGRLTSELLADFREMMEKLAAENDGRYTSIR